MSGCLGQLFQQSWMQLPQFLTAQQLQANSTATLPPAQWVREHHSRVLSTVTTTSDGDVRGTLYDDTSVNGSYHLP
jgi:hypothetical protein